MEKKAFSEGAFREECLAKSINGLPNGKYVLKKYKKTEFEGIESLFGSIKAHTRKSVRLNALARNMAQCLTLEAPVFELDGPLPTKRSIFPHLMMSLSIWKCVLRALSPST